MEKEFVPYEVAVRLRVLGFDEPCFAFYQREYAEVTPTMVDDNEQYKLTGFRTCKNSEIPEHYVSAPTFSQAFRWFRDKYGFHIRFLEPYNNLATPDNKWRSSIHNMNRLFHGYTNGRYIVGDSYEEAELACLDKLLEIVEGIESQK